MGRLCRYSMIVGLASELALGAADDVLLSLGQIATSLAHLRVLGVAEGGVGEIGRAHV